MAIGAVLEINVDLYEALTEITGAAPSEATPVVVVAAYLYGLAKGYGLSESPHLTESQLERADLPEQAAGLITHVVANGSASIDGESLRDRLYGIFGELSRDPRARRLLNKNEALSGAGVYIKVAQIFWNLEATETRPSLPIRSGQKILQSGKDVRADIKVPEANRDFATMKWTERTTTGATGLGAGQAYRSSGQGFRRQGARLAVLAAEILVRRSPLPTPVVAEAEFHPAATGGGRRTATIAWPDMSTREKTPAQAEEQITAPADRVPSADVGRVVVGQPPEVGKGYQRRSFDDEIEQLWADGGDRRVWLRGGPGMGKSYSARRLMEDAMADRGDHREELLIWVDSADAVSVTAALSRAVDRMPRLRLGTETEDQDKVRGQARALLDELATSDWRWLIIFDNADARSLIDSDLIPPGRNPNGRVLITTLSGDTRIDGRGGVVTAGLFTRNEAEAYVKASFDGSGRESAHSVAVTSADMRALARAVAYHPLALSVATATITANRMEVADWLEEFATAERVDTAADAPDPGGYPRGIGATWRIALEKASHELPDGVAVRAAAVAAVMDPDGHPTWLWTRPAVAKWVAGDAETLSLHHGRPVVVERLIDYGVIEFKGGNWRGGLLSMHHLAARAVRELVGGGLLGEIAGLLLDELAGEEAPDDRYFSPVNAVIGTVGRLLTVPSVAPSRRARGFLFLGELRTYMFEFSEAITAYQSAHDEASSITHDGVGSSESLRILALTGLSTAYSWLGQSSERELALHDSLDIARLLAESQNDETMRGGVLAVANALHELGRSEEAATYFARVLELDPAEPVADDKERERWFSLVGFVHVRLGQDTEAARQLARALKVLEQLDSSRRESAVLKVAFTLAPIQVRLGRMRKAERTQARLAAAAGRLAQGGQLFAHAVRSNALKELADMIERDPRRHAETTALYTRAVEGSADLTAASPGSFEHRIQIDALTAQGQHYADNGRHKKAAESFGKVVKITETLADLTVDDPVANRHNRRRHASTLLSLGESQIAGVIGEEVRPERLQAPHASFARAVEEYRQLTEEDPGDHILEFTYAHALWRLSHVQHNLGQQGEAKASLAQAIAILEFLANLASETYSLSLVLDNLVAHLASLGDLQRESGEEVEAIATYMRLLPLVDRTPNSAKVPLIMGLSQCADLLDQAGFSDEAARVRDALDILEPPWF